MNTKSNTEMRKQNIIETLEAGYGDCTVMTNREQKAQFVDFKTAKELGDGELEAVVVKYDKSLVRSNPDLNPYSVCTSLDYIDTEAKYNERYENTKWFEYRTAVIERVKF